MELRHVRYFLAVAEELNFTRAAAKMGIGQPPLSQQIRDLEREIGAALFRRTRLGAELTEAGQAFLPEARAVLEQAGHAVQAARRGARGETGRLRLGFTGSAAFIAAVPEAIRAYQQGYPAVGLSLIEAGTTRLLEQLAANELDAAFVRLGRGDPEGCAVHTLSAEELRIALPAGHALASRRMLRLSSLKGETFILFPRRAGPSLFDEIAGACRAAGFEPALGQEAPQFSSALNLVAAGLGVSLVPASMAGVRVHGVRYCAIEGRTPRVRLALATRSGVQAMTVRNFLALAGVKQADAS